MHGFHSFSQTSTRQTLSIHEAGRAISDQRENLTRFMIHGKLTVNGAELAAKKAASNKSRGRGCGPGHSPKKVRLADLRLLGRLLGREADDEGDESMEGLEYHESRGGSIKARKGITFTLRSPTQIRHFGQNKCVPPSLLIGPVLF